MIKIIKLKAIKNQKFKYLLILIIILIILSFSFLRKQSRAEFSLFYPESCLGSFINPERAQGKSEVDSLEEISEVNSAVYYSGFKEIYCGNFKGPVENGEINKVILKFNWVLTKELIQKPVIEIEGKGILEEILPSKTIEIINTSSKSTPTLLNENSTTIYKFIPLVFAEEQDNSELTNETTTSTQPSETSTLQDIKNETTTFQNITAETTSTESTTTISTSSNELNQSMTSEAQITITTPPKPLFDIHYTLDGSNWNYLGSINSENWKDINFEVPINEWVDISKLQIKINSYPDTDHYLYLESISLEIEYIAQDNTESKVSQTAEDNKSNLQANIGFYSGGSGGIYIPTTTTNTEDLVNYSSSTEIDDSPEDGLPEETDQENQTFEEVQTTNQITEVKPLKVRKYEKEVKIKNTDNIFCSANPFVNNINEEETKIIDLNLSPSNISKKLEIGSLPSGIDITFENTAYELNTNSDKVILKIYRQTGSQKGNFNISIIYNAQNSTILCQLNLFSF